VLVQSGLGWAASWVLFVYTGFRVRIGKPGFCLCYRDIGSMTNARKLSRSRVRRRHVVQDKERSWSSLPGDLAGVVLRRLPRP
jgi:hypothetical protein